MYHSEGKGEDAGWRKSRKEGWIYMKVEDYEGGQEEKCKRGKKVESGLKWEASGP